MTQSAGWPSRVGYIVSYDHTRGLMVWITRSRGTDSPEPFSLKGALLSDLQLPSHVAQAATSVTEEDIAQAVICGPDPARHIAAITQAAEAGYTHVWVHQIGPG